MPPVQRVVALPFRSLSPSIPGVPLYLHYAAWYQAMRGGVIAYSFAGTYAQLVRYQPGAEPPMTWSLDFQPQRFRWEVDGAYDYFLVRSFDDVGPFLFRRATEPVELVAREGAWWLYHRVGGVSAASAASLRP